MRNERRAAILADDAIRAVGGEPDEGGEPLEAAFEIPENSEKFRKFRMKEGLARVMEGKGFDLDPAKVELAEQMGADVATSNPSMLPGAVDAFTGGRGADVILITATTESSGPIITAGEIARYLTLF